MPDGAPRAPPPAKRPPGGPLAASAAAAPADTGAEGSRIPPSSVDTDEANYTDWNGWQGLSKTAPSYELLRTDGYRVFRRKLEVFERYCKKRGATAVSEGGFLVTNSLQGEAAEATEDIDLDLLETEGAFRPLFQVLDEYYKYDDQTELPASTHLFFGKFARQDDVKYTNDYDWDRSLHEENSHSEEETYEDDEDYDYDEHEEEADVAEELPQEVEEAQTVRDEANLSFAGAKKRVAEIAKARGFYPIAALAPENTYQRMRSRAGDTRPVMGDTAWTQWEELLRSRQLLHEVEHGKSDRRFRFGDGKTLEAKQSVTLTAWPFGVKKQVAIHLVEGWTPVLIARPCMQEWGLIQDYRARTFTMKDLPDKGWMKSECDGKGHFIVDLLGGAGRDAGDVLNEGAPADGEGSSGDSKATTGTRRRLTRTGFYEIGSDDEALAAEEVAGLEGHLMDADTHSDLALALEQAASDMKDTLRGPRKRMVWEVIVDQGALSQELLAFLQIEVLQFRVEGGWGFSMRAMIHDFLNKIDKEKPGDIVFAPLCKHRCPWQRANEKIPEERAKQVNGARQREELTLLKMILTAFVKQQNGNRRAHVEGPWQGLHWRKKTWKKFPSYRCRRDQCRLGAKCNVQGTDMPCQKPTRLQSTNKGIIHRVNLACARTEDDVILQGKLAQQAQNYPRPMARAMANLIAYQGMADNISDINAAAEVCKDIDAMEYTDVMQELMKPCSASTIRTVERPRVSLGHPSRAALAVAMQHAGASTEWAQCARLFKCEICLSRQRPRAVRVAVLPRSKRFNEVTCTDVHYITRMKKEREILSIMGEFTRYDVDYPISEETFLNETKLWEKLWTSWASKPETMRTNMGGSHAAKRTRNWMSKRSIELDLIPRAPALGAQPKIPCVLCDEDFGPSEQAAPVDPMGEVRAMTIGRAIAATAFIEANCSRAARAALLARSRPTRRNYEIGERVYLWRPEQTQGLEKRHRRGPALAAAAGSKVNEDYAGPASPLSAIEKLKRVLRRTKGTCNYQDLAEEGRLPQHDDTLGDMGEQHQPSAQAPAATGEADGPTRATAAAAPGDPQPATPSEDKGGGPVAASAGASGGAAQEPSRLHVEAMAKRSVEEAGKRAGIPPANRARPSRAKLAPQSEEAALADGVGDEMLLLEEPAETVDMLAFKRKAPAIVEGGLMPGGASFTRRSWRPSRWKMKDGQKVANARELYRGSKHSDVAEGQLDKEALALSRLGRRKVVLWASLSKWRSFGAVAKSAFLQADDLSARCLELRASPTKLRRYRPDAVAKEIGLRNRKLEAHAVGGLIGERAGDFIGRGEGATDEQDLNAKLDDTECFQARLGAPGEVEQSLSTHSATLKFEKYLRAVKPITVEKHRGADPASELSPKELANFRALADARLHFGFDKAWINLRVGSYTGASWANGRDGSSQGGHAIFIGPADELNASTATPFAAIEWAPRKLQRLCKSSLSAEVYLAWSLRPDLELEEAMVHTGGSPFFTDAECLYDESRSATAGQGTAEKRAAIEVKIVNEQMTEIGATWKWVNTQRQMADGPARLSARQMMADVLRREVHASRYDPDFAAGKKISKRAMEQREKELDDAGEALHDTLETTPVTKAKEKAKAKGKRHFGTSGARLAAALAASAGGSAAGQLFNPPTPADWNDLIMKVVAFGFPETEPAPASAKTAVTGTDPKQTKLKKVRSVLVRSQCHYNLDLSTPRLQSLPEYAHGAFMTR
ncbi:unnamed protein product [Prorocentrum cordatum]|uniref:Uncharacterized protein n=1 Tax=Prorocentrum cordatum TaxID=2364126 RepID=A0ABN9VVP4_9DINO|nr:unnamed protein product [Polarella glacialis]